MNDQENAWRAEFERLGERLVWENTKQGAIYNDERKRQFAFRWLADEEAKRRKREQETFWYVKFTYHAAIWAAALGAIGIIVAIIVALLHL